MIAKSLHDDIKYNVQAHCGCARSQIVNRLVVAHTAMCICIHTLRINVSGWMRIKGLLNLSGQKCIPENRTLPITFQYKASCFMFYKLDID